MSKSKQKKLSKFREQHAAGIAVEFTERAGIFVRRVQAPIECYWSRGLLTQRQHDAGVLLREAFEMGVCGVRDQGPYLVVRGSVGTHYSEARLGATMSFRRAIRAIGWRLAAVVLPVVCDERTIDRLAADVQRERKALMALLVLGLDELGDHYGLADPKRPPQNPLDCGPEMQRHSLSQT